MSPGRSVFLPLALVPLLAACLFDPEPFSEEEWSRKVGASDRAALYAPHEAEGEFFNPWMIEEEGRFIKFLKWRLSTAAAYSDEEEAYKPVLVPDLIGRIALLAAESDFLAWIGHATFLLRLDGVYWLTDPMLSDRALLPKRVTPPAISLADLDRLKGPLQVVISHNHYDHLDADTIRALPDSARIIVPLGLQDFVGSLHGGEVLALDWWQEIRSGAALLTCLPAQHWSRRLGQARNTTLWASFMIQTPHHTLYYGGDSGYFVGYKEFGARFPGIDYALLPITAYRPRWFMHYPHLDVKEALAAFRDLKARYFVPTQWGAFRLGENPPGFPMLELERALTAQHREAERYLRPGLGEIVLLGKGEAGVSSPRRIPAKQSPQTSR